MGVETPVTSADKKRTLRRLGKIVSQVHVRSIQFHILLVAVM